MMEEILMGGVILGMRYLSPMSRMVCGTVNWRSSSQRVNSIAGRDDHGVTYRRVLLAIVLHKHQRCAALPDEIPR